LNKLVPSFRQVTSELGFGEKILPEFGTGIISIGKLPGIGFTPVETPEEQIIPESQVIVPYWTGIQFPIPVFMKIGTELIGIGISR
jgi:hypothetical protein